MRFTRCSWMAWMFSFHVGTIVSLVCWTPSRTWCWSELYSNTRNDWKFKTPQIGLGISFRSNVYIHTLTNATSSFVLIQWLYTSALSPFRSSYSSHEWTDHGLVCPSPQQPGIGVYCTHAVSHMIYMMRRSGVRADSLEMDIVAISLFVASKFTARMRPFHPPADLPLQLVFDLLSTNRKADDILPHHLLSEDRVLLRSDGSHWSPVQLQTRAMKNARWYLF